MTLKEMIADLPQECSLGAKNNSQGIRNTGALSISLGCGRRADFDVCSATMNAAYDAKLIRACSQKLGHEALIKPNISHALGPRERLH